MKLPLACACILIAGCSEPETVREIRTWYASGCEGGDTVSDTLEYPLGLRDSLRVVGTSLPCGKRHERLDRFYEDERHLLTLNESLTDTLDVSCTAGWCAGLHVYLERVRESDLPLAFSGGLAPEAAISGNTFTGASGVGIVEYWPHYGSWVRLQRIVRSGAVSDTVDLDGMRIGTTIIEPFRMPTPEEWDAIVDEVELDFAPLPPPR